ncbi:SpvB/TcaC N-terminal domain-containing protein [Psychroserpens sp. SPM9]|uniref:SpvB/TcaC N-terminal domain-containing protein n=1 Tax=Psychroserpens sp. SPM9 TaxID=2975598 RepID=UPI0021A9007C|nr:SpvB/TcaC N-terminal domain-containing protein [Psychroserpens sp. SPM9]MDG5490682.1 SpvB/TcaC N-terminal domain-containing protein [Psychroserpens sp. SPM9]
MADTLLKSAYKAVKKKPSPVVKPYKRTISSENNFKIETVFSADLPIGNIEVDTITKIDNPKDNYFNVIIPDNFGLRDKKIVLEYEMYGLDENSTPSKSINHQWVYGGYMVKTSNQWVKKREEIDCKWMRTGDNSIFFTLPPNADYHYKIRNVKIKTEASSITKNDFTDIVLTNKNYDLTKSGKRYVVGFLRGFAKDFKVFANKQELKLHENVFEGFIDVDHNSNITIELFGDNGLRKIKEKQIRVESIEADNFSTIELEKRSLIQKFEAYKKSSLQIGNATLTLNDSSIIQPKTLTAKILRAIDLPDLTPGLINVTAGGRAYRFLPDGTQFVNPVTLKIPYDSTAIPKGYTEKDIKTYFFDTKSKRWLVLEKEAINYNEKVVVSKTTHFTDYINGIIQAPESPQTNAFTSTIMSNVKPANPSSEITMISPPKVSQKGDANVSFPIKIPSGRKGMQPQLGLQYNSESSNGWLGIGWNLNTPAITIDTRWGVPLFNTSKESELYMLNGEQLMYPKIENSEGAKVDWMPNRHYDASSQSGIYSTVERDRIANAIFTPRKQGSFSKIERLGNNPSNYYWKVTTSDGTIFWYGGKSNVVNNSVIKDDSGNIVHWGLFMVEDVYKNNVKYEYSNYVAFGYNGANANLNGGRVFRIANIYYTGYAENNGLYRVEFVSNSSTGNLRQDPIIDARLGVKRVVPGVLSEIRVYDDGDLIRYYALKYGSSVFFKSRLNSIAERDANNVEFYEYEFDYYNDIGRNKFMFNPPKSINVPNFSANYTLGFGNALGTSRINSSESTELSWDARIAAGISLFYVGNNPGWVFTAGAVFGENYTNSKGKIAMVDMDGNGLDDILYRSGNKLKYLPHIVDQNGDHIIIDEEKTVLNINNYQKTKGKTVTVAGDSYDMHFLKFYAGTKRFKTKNETDIYITDGNGDLLPDIVNNNSVYFNTGLNGEGNNVFETSSTNTPNMLITADPSLISPDDVEDIDPISEEVSTHYDIVRTWIAPRSGYIRITDSVQFMPQSSNSTLTYSIESEWWRTNDNYRLYLREFNSSFQSENILITHVDSYNPSLDISDIHGHDSYNGLTMQINKGEKIYFRVHKNIEGENDVLLTNPTIKYVASDGTDMTVSNFDQNNLNRDRFNYGEDFLLGDNRELELEGTGNIQITWPSFTVSNQSDDVEYKIIQSTRDLVSGDVTENDIFYKFCPKNSTTFVSQTGSVSNFNINSIPVNSQISFRFEVNSDSNVRWEDTEWKPKFVYTPDANASNDGIMEFEKEIAPIYSIYYEYNPKEYQLESYSNGSGTFVYNLPNTSTTYSVLPNTIYPTNSSQALTTEDSGEFLFVAKKNGVVIGKRTVMIDEGVISLDNDTPISFYTGNATTDPNDILVDFAFYIKGRNNHLLFERYNNALLAYTSMNQHNKGNIIIGHTDEWNNFPISDNSHFLRRTVYSCNDDYQHLGSLNRSWGQFLYNDELDDDDSVPNDAFGKLINRDIVNLPSSNSSDDILDILGVDSNYCSDTYTDQQDIEDCLIAQLEELYDIPDEGSVDENTDLESLVNTIFTNVDISALSNLSALMSMKPFRYEEDNALKEKWIGFSDKQYTTRNSVKNGDFTFSEFDEVFENPDDEESPYLEADQSTGMYAMTLVHKSSARSYSAGFGSLTFSESESSYSNRISGFMDINGDRYPDLLTSISAQPTNMTGGHTAAVNNYNIDPISSTDSDNSSLSVKRSYPIAGRHKAKESKSDTGDPKYHAGIGLSANLGGENKEKSSFIDLNGDGLLDRVTHNGSTFKYRLNTGSGFSNTQDDFALYNSIETHPNSLSASASISANLNLGNVPFSVSLGYSSTGSNTDISLQDMNGDGLIDLLVFNNSNNAKVYFNVGNKFLNSPVSLTYANNSYVSLFDDGKTTSASLAGSLSYFYGWSVCCPLPFPPFYWPIIFVKVGGSAGGSASLSVSETERQFSDFNNDGYADYVKKDGRDLKVYYSKIGRTDKLKTVSNPLGGLFTIDYKNKSVDYNNPTSKWVMSSVLVDDGRDIALDGKDIYRMDFEYDNGYYDRRERTFYGYETVKTKEFINGDTDYPTLYRTSISKYHNKSYFLQGLAIESRMERADGGSSNTYSITQNTYELYKVNPDGTIDLDSPVDLDYDIGGTEGRRQAAPLLTEALTELKEFATSSIISKVNMQYDEYGRVINFIDHGDLAIEDDDYHTTISYHDLNNNILNVPREMIIYKGNNGTSNVIRRRSTQVENSNTGNITSVRAWLNDSDYSESKMEYNDYGNLVVMTYPKNYNGQSLSYKYTYDDLYNKYIVNTLDAFGYSSKNTYDSKFDVVLKSIDITGNKIDYNYDSFGRLVSIVAPKESANSNAYTVGFQYMPTYSHLVNNGYSGCVSEEDFVPVAVTKRYDALHPTNPLETITIVDGLSRPIQIKKDVVLNVGTPNAPEYKEFMSVSGMVTYDDFGRVIKQYHPKKEVKNCLTNFLVNEIDDPLSNYYILTQLDELDRPISLTDQAGFTSDFLYAIENDANGNLTQLTTSTVDQGTQNVVTHTYRDVRGRTTSVNNLGSNGDIWTKYSYNPIGELISYTDNQNIQVYMSYDKLGRRISLKHPDNGNSFYNYDLSGNLLRYQTANLGNTGNFIEYEYEFNRLTKIVFPEIASGNISDVTYGYGGPDSGNKTGKLIYQQDATGTQEFDYGNMGELTYNKRTIVAPNLPTRTFETYHEYDSFNRLMKLVYPDGEKVAYRYDLGGNLNSVVGEYQGSEYPYVKQVDYDYFGQKTFILYGNGTNNTYTYQPELRRLDNLVSKTADNNVMFNNTYKYDNIGNIKYLENNSAYNPNNKLGGAYMHKYSYDNLNRLVDAEGGFKGFEDNTADYRLKMEYNTTHGITVKKQAHTQSGSTNEDNSYANTYKYNEGTHQVIEINNGSSNTKYFKYDLNGNLINELDFDSNERRFYWDESNRLRVVAGKETMHHYIYDATGERTLKSSSSLEEVYNNGQPVNTNSTNFDNYTTYASPYLVIDANQRYSKHYFMGSQRIVSKLGEQDIEIFNSENPRLALAGKRNDSESRVSMDEIRQRQISDLRLILEKADLGTPNFKDYEVHSDSLSKNEARAPQNYGMYFFHPDHLGTGTYLTDMSGNPYQFFINLPFGETMYEQHSYAEDYINSYKFNGKELDDETNLYYYGARYYDPSTSIWLSVDPIALWNPIQEVEHYIEGQHNQGVYNSKNLNVYGYTYQNPIKYIDPNGKQVDVVLLKPGTDDTIISGASNITSLPNTLQIVAHGTPNYFRNVDDKGNKTNKIDGPITFNKAMKNNDEWNNNKDKKGFTVIIYSCRTGSLIASKTGKSSVVKRISEAYPNVSFIAPSLYGWFSPSGLSGSYGKKKGKDGKDIIDKDNPGYWFVYKAGEIVEVYDATWTPGTDPVITKWFGLWVEHDHTVDKSELTKEELGGSEKTETDSEEKDDKKKS